MKRQTACVVVALLSAASVLAYLWISRAGWQPGLERGFPLADGAPSPAESSPSTRPGGPPTRLGQSPLAAPAPHDPPAPHPLLDDADDAIWADGHNQPLSTADARLRETIQAVIRAASEAHEPASLTIDYPQHETVFPPEIVPPTFLWHEPDADADTWLLEVAFADLPEPLYVLVAGRAPPTAPLDPAAIAGTNEIYRPTPYQASARSWTPSAAVWQAIKRGSVEQAARVQLVGFRSQDAAQPAILSRGQISITTSRDPVGAPIFYRDVPLAPALTEKGVIKPLADEAVSLIGWRLRDISKTESRLLLTDVPTCTNCHSFSADGKTLGMDLDGPQGDKGAYVIATVRRETPLRSEDVISWNSFADKPPDHKTIGFLSRISPDGQFAVTTLNESVYVCNFMDYRFLQVFFPTRGILGYYNRTTNEIKTLPGADDPQYVHCDAVWSPDGEMLVFARAKAKDPYPENGRLAQQANDAGETQIQYDLYRIPFRGGQGGTPEPIAGASGNGLSNTFPKVSPDGRWIVFVQCRNGQLMRPDSTLWIVPFGGGTARRMRCNTRLMNSWHSFSPNSRWLVFSSKANTPYTQMFLTHIDQAGNDSPAVLVPNATAANRAVNIPEFVNVAYEELASISVPALDYYRHASRGARLRKEGRLDEALAEFDVAVKLQPDFQHAHVEAAIALTEKGQLDQALQRLYQALSLDPQQSRAQGYAGLVLAQSGRLDEAVTRFQKALEIDPYYRTAHRNLGKIYQEQGQLEQATAHLRMVAELDDQDPQGHFELGMVLLQRKRVAEAIEQFQKTLALDPQALDACLLLSKAWVLQGDFRAAVAALRQATAIDANNVRPLADLAWLLAVCPADEVRDGAEAVELARRACAITNDTSPVLLNTLSAAYAEVGDFPAAIATAHKALKLVDSRDKFQIQWIRANLACYEAGKPCRPTPAAP
jgi:tetratricopeptide (TPR) repeat protein